MNKLLKSNSNFTWKTTRTSFQLLSDSSFALRDTIIGENCNTNQISFYLAGSDIYLIILCYSINFLKTTLSHQF